MRGRARGRSSSQVSDWGLPEIPVPARVAPKWLPLDATDHYGVFHWLGTAGLTTLFSTPNAKVALSASSIDSGPLSKTINRTADDFYTGASSANPWWQVDLGAGRSLMATHLSHKQRTSSSNLMQACTVAGSNDDTNWTTLATKTNGQLIESPNAWNDIALSAATPFRFFRLTMDTLDTNNKWYLVIQEIELFGDFAGSVA